MGIWNYAIYVLYVVFYEKSVLVLRTPLSYVTASFLTAPVSVTNLGASASFAFFTSSATLSLSPGKIAHFEHQ